MLIPKTTKFRYYHKKSSKGVKSPELIQGNWGLYALNKFRLKLNQMESIKNIISKKTKKLGKVWFRTFLHLPLSKKSLGTRMGSGKGSIDTWYAIIKPGDIIVELSGVSDIIAKQTLRAVAFKLPLKVKIIHKLL